MARWSPGKARCSGLGATPAGLTRPAHRHRATRAPVGEGRIAEPLADGEERTRRACARRDATPRHLARRLTVICRSAVPDLSTRCPSGLAVSALPERPKPPWRLPACWLREETRTESSPSPHPPQVLAADHDHAGGRLARGHQKDALSYPRSAVVTNHGAIANELRRDRARIERSLRDLEGGGLAAPVNVRAEAR